MHVGKLGPTTTPVVRGRNGRRVTLATEARGAGSGRRTGACGRRELGVHPGAEDVCPATAPPVASDSAPNAEREEAIASLKRKRRFAEDALADVSVNGVLWIIWALTDRSTDGSIPWPTWVSAVWGFLLLVDAWRAYGSWPRSLRRPITETEIEQEMQRSRRA